MIAPHSVKFIPISKSFRVVFIKCLIKGKYQEKNYGHSVSDLLSGCN